MKLMSYALVFALATAPLVATDNSQNTVTTQQKEIRQQDDTSQPKSFLERYWDDYRCYILAGVGILTIAALAYLRYNNGIKNPPMKSILLFGDPEAKLDLSVTLEPVKSTDLPQENTGFAYPTGYGERSKQHVDTLRGIDPIFESMCNGNRKRVFGNEDTFECGQAVAWLEKMYRGGKDYTLDTGYLVAGTADYRLHKIYPDHIEHADALERIRQAVNKLKPAIPEQPTLIEQSVDINPLSAQSNSDSWWDYWCGSLAG
jgi:hypothetical protein